MTLADPLEISVLLSALRTGALAPEALMATIFERIAAYPDKSVFIALRDPEAVLAEVAAIDHALPLAGIPFVVKDNIDVAFMPTTAGCPEFAYVPLRDAAVVARLRTAGAILIGKTNLDQFATGLNGTRSPYGAPRCVFNSDYVSGGSSSGSAVAVAAGLCAFALGTDTAGSGRVPAAFNNIVGLKPTRGRIPAAGVVPACQSLDCVSILSNSAHDAAQILDVAQGPDEADPYSRAVDDLALPTRPRVGVLTPEERFFDGNDAFARLYDQALDEAAKLGWEIVGIDYAPFRAAAALLYEDAFIAERLAAIRPFFEAHEAAIDPVVRAIIGGARRFNAADAFLAMTRLQALKRRASAELSKVDTLLLPTAPTIFTVAAMQEQPVARNAVLGRYTNFVNLLDMAAVALPAGFADRLPFGVTLIGPAFTDRALLAHASALHAALSPGTGLRRTVPRLRFALSAEDRISLVVAGAHLSGMPLNHELTALGGRLERAATTAPGYRLFALSTSPPKPGLMRDSSFTGPGIAVELWSLAPEALGRFTASLPPPMGIGKVMLADGTEEAGFVCEAQALQEATDITGFGGWHAYVNRSDQDALRRSGNR